MKAIVCGGREYGSVHAERLTLIRVLSRMALDEGLTLIAEGGAFGADACARHWAGVSRVDCMTYAADWKCHGKAAGPIRNQRMLAEFKPDVVIAFPGGRGTADMVGRARKAGVRVIEVPVEGSGEKCGDISVPGERPTSEYSPLAIAVARERGLLRVDRDGLGWISGMEPDGPAKGEEKR